MFSIPNFFEENQRKNLNDTFAPIIFASIQLRNFLTLLVSTIYCIKVARSPNLIYSAEDATSLTTLLDFELVMISVVPYQYFKRFVNKFKNIDEINAAYQ